MNPKVSAFCLTINAIERQYPVIESIKSFLPMCDELIVIDGCSTDNTVDEIKKIGDKKIRIVADEHTKWDKDWIYSRMGHNSNRGIDECKGDIILKFDIDFVAHEYCATDVNLSRNFRKDCVKLFDEKKKTFYFVRKNLILADRYFIKCKKTLGFNRFQCNEEKMGKIRYGIDIDRWGWGFEPIVPQFEENGIWFGTMLRNGRNSFAPSSSIFNYDFVFKTKEVARDVRHRHIMAVVKQKSLKYKLINQPTPIIKPEKLVDIPDYGMALLKRQSIANYGDKKQVTLSISSHPKVIREKIKLLTPEHQGYNCWGWFKDFKIDKASYYD